MPFHVGRGCFPAIISHRRIRRIAQSNTPPEMTLWEKIKELYCSTHQTEALACIRQICHPPAGTTREDVVRRFEQLRALAYAGYEGNIQSGRHGESDFCILDTDGQEILSVTLDNAGNYTVKCKEHHETYRLTMDTERGEDHTDRAEETTGTFRTFFLPAAMAPRTAKAYDYNAVWSEWERAAPAEELSARAAAVQKMRDCLNNGKLRLDVGRGGLTTLPDHLPPSITALVITHNNYLTHLPELPSGLWELSVSGERLTCLPALPSGLRELSVSCNQLTRLPALPPGLQIMSVRSEQLICLPALPSGLQSLLICGNQLTRLPALPSGLRTLSIRGQQLARLPALPSGLRDLSVSGNRLTCLPALPSGVKSLLIRGHQLIRLPALPSALRELSVSGNQLTRLPTLPSGLQSLRVFDNQLTSLPALPSGLWDLSVSGNRQLTSLPTLPSGLRELLVSGNHQLTRLPAFPSGLREILVSGNRLTSLPALPSGLRELAVSGNQLTSLPALPPGLELLSARDNHLISLPALPSGLRMLAVSDNRLTRLPESIIALPSYANVNLERNPLSERTLQALLDITRAPDYSGPIIRFDMEGAFVHREARALHLAVSDWLAPVQKGKTAPADRWHAAGQEDNAAAFSLFLDRLREKENFKKDAGFKAQIASWLVQLAEDDALRAKTFTMATEATSSCEDRVTLALHRMRNVQLVHNAEKGEYDNNLAALVATGREMFRLGKLEQIARQKASTLVFVDEIEVYLGYQNKLKERLGLTSVTAGMRFFDISGVTASDLQTAELQVKSAENHEFSEWILEWEPLRTVLERRAPERYKALSEKYESDYNNTYRMLSDTELKPFGLVGNIDAETAIGVRAMEHAKKEFLNGLRPLAGKMLGSCLKARWRLH